MKDWILIIVANLVLFALSFRRAWKQGRDERWLRRIRNADQSAQERGWAFYSVTPERATWKRGGELWGIER